MLYNLPGGGKREVEAKGEENMRWKGRQKKKAESKTNSQMSTCSSSGWDEAKRIR